MVEMSFVIATPDLVQSAAADLAGVRSSLAEAAVTAAGPTTGIAAAAQDEVSVAISSMFGNFGQEFQALTAQAQAFHQQFVCLMNTGAGAYVAAEAANAAQVAEQVAGGQAAAAAVPAQNFNLLDGILDIETGPGGTLVTIGTPRISLPPVNIPPINLSAFSLPQISIPSINIPPFATPPISVGAFSLPQITTPAIAVPPINLPAITIPGFNLPQIQVPGITLPSITVPQINFPGIQLPDIAVLGNNQTLITINSGVLGLVSINLQNFDINASIGLNTPGFIQGFTIPPIVLGAFTIPPIGLSGFTIPPIGLSGFTIPSITVPPIGLSGFTLPPISEPGFATPPLTISPIGIGIFGLPNISIPGITIESVPFAQFEIPPL
jgi:PE family